MRGPVETRIIEELPEDDKEPPPPPPEIEPPPPYVPPPEISIDIADGHRTDHRDQQRHQRAPGRPAAAAGRAEARRAQRRQDAAVHAGKGARITQPEYPPASRRAGEEGTVTLQVFVPENGRAGEVKVAKSSGFPKLDEAAVKEVQRNWRFVPGKEDGKPVPMWHTFAVTFRLTD